MRKNKLDNNFYSDQIECPEVIQPIEFHKVKTVNKGWGSERIFANSKTYCGKLLEFNSNTSFSTHYHKKNETWLVFLGRLKMTYFNLENADRLEKILEVGDVVYVPAGQPHKIEALEKSMIIEVSDPFFKADNYRVEKGSSQNK